MNEFKENILNDVTLSWEAKGIYYQILSLSKSHVKNIESLLSDKASDNIQILHNGLQELEGKGYIKIIELHDKKGQIYNECFLQGLTDPMVEYWNTLPYVRKHRPQSKAYRRATDLFTQLREGFDFSKLDQGFLSDYRIANMPGKYTDDEIKDVLANVSKFLSPGTGYKIKSKILTRDSWKGGLNLDEIIYSGWSGSSLFFICAMFGPLMEIVDECPDRDMYEKYVELLKPHLDPLFDPRMNRDLKYAMNRITKAQKMLVEHNNHAYPHLIGDLRGPLVLIRTYAEFLGREYNIKMHRIGPGTRNWQRFLDYLKGEGVNIPLTVGTI